MHLPHDIQWNRQAVAFQHRRNQQPKCDLTDRAFTLVELLTVIAIIGVLSALGFIGARSISQGASVKGAVSLTSSMCLAARSQATTLGQGARIIIDVNYDADNPEWYLRRITVLEQTDSDGWSDSNVPEWQLADKPTLLPKGTYFFEEYSSGFGEMQFDFTPNDEKPATTAYYYEFDGNGRLIDASGNNELAKIIFVTGILESDGTLNIPDQMLSSRDGFIIRRAGRLTFFDDPGQITTSTTAP